MSQRSRRTAVPFSRRPEAVTTAPLISGRAAPVRPARRRGASRFGRGVSVVGLGYIGLPTSAVIAAQGVQVFGVDVNVATVEAVNEGHVPIVEPDLDVAVAGAVARGYLTASASAGPADVHILAVPTPFREGHQPDLRYVRSAAEAVAPHLQRGDIVILESTSPPGTTLKVSEWIAAQRPDLRMPHQDAEDPDIHVAHCPERVLPGRIMVELITNDRVVGGLTPACATRAAELYALFCKGEILLTDAASAEMAKLVENSFRDVNIAFANELSNICERLDFDVWEIIRLANRHPRVNVLNPGPGVGGHCIAVDPWFIVAAAPQEATLIRHARDINDARPDAVVQRIREVTRGDGPVACLGLAFKANIDDMRESPASHVVAALAAAEPTRTILAVEPHTASLPEGLRAFPNVRLTHLDEALAEAETLALLVDHRAFQAVEPSVLATKSVVDTRGFWR